MTDKHDMMALIPLEAIERSLRAGRHVANKAMADALERAAGLPIPERVLQLICQRLRATEPNRRGRKPGGSLAPIQRTMAAYYYDRYLVWLQSRRQRCGLDGWSCIRNADWWQGPPHERAALMTAHALRHLWPNVSARHIKNVVSSSK